MVDIPACFAALTLPWVHRNGDLQGWRTDGEQRESGVPLHGLGDREAVAEGVKSSCVHGIRIIAWGVFEGQPEDQKDCHGGL